MNGLRIPPHSEEAERGVLGSILLDPVSCIGKCTGLGLTHGDFYDRRHQTLFTELAAMYQQNSRVMDAITIGEWLKDHNALEKVGGYDYLVQLQDSALVPAHVEFYCDIVSEKKMLRQIIEQSSEAIDAAYKGETDAETILGESSESLFSIRRHAPTKHLSNAAVADRVIARWKSIGTGEQYGLPWHIPEVGDVFGNFQSNGNPYFIAAEPGGGKSVCLQNLFTKWAILMGRPCAIASIEMTHEKLIARLLAERADISAWSLENAFYGEGSPEEQTATAREMIAKAERAKEQIVSAPLHINDRPMNTDEVCAYGLRMYEKHGIEALGIDYFQLLNPPDHRRLDGLEAVKYNCSKLLNFSKATGVIVIALSQITKLSTGRDGAQRKPRQDDLFGGRIIDANSEGTVIFYNRDGQDYASIAKNRNGACGDVPVWFNRARLRFQSGGDGGWQTA